MIERFFFQQDLGLSGQASFLQPADSIHSQQTREKDCDHQVSRPSQNRRRRSQISQTFISGRGSQRFSLIHCFVRHLHCGTFALMLGRLSWQEPEPYRVDCFIPKRTFYM
jgi:hypothetical protein